MPVGIDLTVNMPRHFDDNCLLAAASLGLGYPESCVPRATPNSQWHRSGNSRLRRLPAPGEMGRWAAEKTPW